MFFLSLGKSDCPYYARSELLGDKLVKNLPDFQLHKIVIKPEEWDVSCVFNFYLSTSSKNINFFHIYMLNLSALFGTKTKKPYLTSVCFIIIDAAVLTHENLCNDIFYLQ